MANELTKWNLNEFTTFLLIHASHADFDFSPEEETIIRSLLSEEDYDQINDEYENMSDYQRLETIISYKGLHYPTIAQKDEMMGRMVELFQADGDYSSIEKNLYRFLDRLL